MEIVVNVEAWIKAAMGGGMIGLAAALMMLANGRIAGVSGVLGGLLFDRNPNERAWRGLFVVGLGVGASLTALLRPDLAVMTPQVGWLGLIVAGAVVGFGTRMGSGCTSGHGVCGIGRLSARSLVATATFMASGFVTVFVVRHVLGWQS